MICLSTYLGYEFLFAKRMHKEVVEVFLLKIKDKNLKFL